MIWHKSPECKTRVHCRACLTDPDWHKAMSRDWQMPESYFEERKVDGKKVQVFVCVCPHGVTLNSLPELQTVTPVKRTGDCPYSVRTCCGHPDTCQIDGADCADIDPATCQKRPDLK